VIEYPDRLARFGYEYLKFFLESFGVGLVIINGKENEEDRHRELAKVFPLNSRYCDDAIMKANEVLRSSKGQDSKKVIFGSKKLFEKLKRKHLTGKRREKLKKMEREKTGDSLYQYQLKIILKKPP